MHDRNIFFPTSQQFSPPPENGRVIIVTRTKNRPLLLARAFASVLGQTYQNWHLYLVNDGGDPDSVERLIAQYQSAFNDRLTVKHHAHSLGMEAASNAGLNGAQGDYIIIHDDDDSWKPNFLEQTVSYLEAPEHARFAAVATNCTVIFEKINGDEVVEERRESWGYFKERVDMFDLLKLNNIPPICTLIRKQVVDAIGLYNDSLPVLGDWDYNLRILMIGDIGTINRELANYHHRVPSGQGIDLYQNSVSGGNSKHLDYQVLYRNSMIRKLLQKDPAYASLFHVLARLGETHQIQTSLPQLHQTSLNSHQIEQLSRVISNLDKAFRPARWLWNKLVPARRVIAKLRGRGQ